MLLWLMLAAGDPPRPINTVYTTERSAAELQTCLIRYWSARARVTPIPVDRGMLIDVLQRVGLGNPGEAPFTAEVRDTGATRTVSASYRHPWSAKTAKGYLGLGLKRCAPELLSKQQRP